MVFGETKINDAASRASTSLAITGKCQATRPKGCAGIFFQLFDWHRRFAKKQLFSRKLLPPARAKNLKGDERMPVAKLHYIADENKGGFPSLRKNDNLDIMALEHKHEMKSPGLVARLMGLESLPTERQKKVKKASPYETFGDKPCRLVTNNKGLESDELNMEKGQMRHDRPQKLQKTGLSERRAVTRFGAEALLIKGVLSRARNHNHPKLASPLKSPRVSSSSRSVPRTSRLMIDATTRILEPGLQSRNRAKCALPYISPMHYASHNEVIIETSMGQSSCRNCGNMLDMVNLPQNVEEDQHQPLEEYVFSTSASSSKQSSGMNGEEKVFCKRRQEETLNSGDELSLEQWHLPCEKNASQRYGSGSGSSSIAPNSSHLGDCQILSGAKLGAALRSRRASTAANSVSAAKDFVALNRNLSGQARPRVPVKAENSRADVMRKSRVRQVDSSTQIRSPVLKMRAVNDNAAVETTTPMTSTMMKQRKVDAFSGKEGARGNTSAKSGVISFTFNAPMKHRNGPSSLEVVHQRMAKADSNHGSTMEVVDNRKSKTDSGSDPRELVLDGSEKKESLRKQLALSGDALGALLEQKLKELTSQEHEEMNNAYATPKRTTAMILQELIAALTADPLLSQDSDTVDSEKAFQVKEKKEGILGELSSDANRFSPGSVLDASFSNESCISSSFDESSGLILKPDSVDFSCDLPQPLDIDDDLLDSATSLDKGRTGRDKVINLIVCINNLFSQLYHAGVRLEGSRLIHAKEINLQTELIFSNGTHPSSEDADGFIVNLSLLDELECLATSTWIILINGFGGLVDGKEGKELREFLFDCLLECLDSKYRPCSDFGYWRWRRLPPRLNTEILVRDVEAGLKKWAGLSGMSVDKMIEWEMSHSLGKWVDFDIEAFENGIDIEEDILQNMVEEVLADLFPNDHVSKCGFICI